LWLLPPFTSHFLLLIRVCASSSSAFVQPNCGCLDFHSSDFVSIPALEVAQASSLAALLAAGVDDRVKRWRLRFLKNYSTTEDTG
jgi:hypothetical protein